MTVLRRQPQNRSRGFTLVEVMVSMVILSVMLLAVASALSFVTNVWISEIGSADNYAKARVALGLLDRDVETMVMRRDLAAFVNSSPGNLTFYTNVQGNPGTDTRALSLVAYAISNPTTQPALQRLNYGMNFVTTSGVTPTVGNTTSLPAPTHATLYTETIFTGIVQFQWQFIDGTGAILTPPFALTSTPPASSSPPTGKVPFWFDYAVPSASYNPRSIVISMLVLSNPAYTIATQGSGTVMSKLLADFPSTLPTANTAQTFGEYWNSILNPATGSLDPSLPTQVRGGIEVFERRIDLPASIPSS